MTDSRAETIAMPIEPAIPIVDPAPRSGLLALIGEPGLVLALILLPIGMIAVVGWRAAFAVGLRRGRRAPLHPAFQDLIGRAVAVGPGTDVGDDLLAGGGAGLDRGRAHVREQHHV